MQLTEKADVVNEAEAQAGAPEEAGQPGDLKGPRLTQEQREWLNTVFIPNFRAELIRTLKPEDLLSSKERRKRRAGRPQPPIDAGKQQAPSPTLPRAGSSEETDARPMPRQATRMRWNSPLSSQLSGSPSWRARRGG